MTSTNGMDWEPAGVPARFVGQQVVLEHIAVGNSTLLAAQHYYDNGYLAASDSGLEWRDASVTNEFRLSQVTYGNGQFLAVDNNSGGVCVSQDGLHWSSPVLLTNGEQSASSPHVRFGQGLFLASGYEGALFTSLDGKSWTFRPQDHALPFVPTSLVCADGQFLTGGWAYGIGVSSNGADWRLLFPTNSFPALAYGNGTIVAAGGAYAILTSTDLGRTWVDRSPRFAYGSSSPSASRIVFGGGTFVTCGTLNYPTYGGYVLASSDATTWQKADVSSVTAIIDMAYGAGLFVAVRAISQQGSGGEILVSTNGISWKRVYSDSTNWLNSIAFGNQRFVAGTGGSSVLMSADGMTWHQYQTQGIDYLNQIIFGNGQFLATASPGLCSSADGLSWSRLAAPAEGGYLQLLAAIEGAFVIVADDYCLYQSAPLLRLGSARWLPAGPMEWTVSGAPHVNYRIELTEDFRTWQALAHITNAPAAGTFIDPITTQRPARFYRVVTE
jgi:hypothetical protein